MPGVPRELAEHKLHVDPKEQPIKQTLRPFNEERRRAISIEVKRLLDAGFIIEINHPKWLANPVMVLKKNKTWRMFIDYTNLNSACPKDEFMLPGSTRSLTPRRDWSRSLAERVAFCLILRLREGFQFTLI
jgi:hypothetical protein